MPLKARTALPIGELAPLVEVTGTMHWMREIEERATPAGILPADWPFRPGGALPAATVALLSQGGPFESADVQQAVLHALDKEAIAKSAFPEEDLVLLSAVAGEELDARTVAYDPALARELLAKAGVPDGFKTALLFPAGDDQLATMAKLLVEPLAQAGIYASPEAVAPSELRVVAPLRRQAGEPVLWLERR
jgi:ABC-type transport system substrate-binding protein